MDAQNMSKSKKSKPSKEFIACVANLELSCKKKNSSDKKCLQYMEKVMLEIWNGCPAPTENVIHESILWLTEKEHIFQLTPTTLSWQLGKKWKTDEETNHMRLKDIVTIHEPLNVIQKQEKYSIDIRSSSYSFIITTTEKNDKDKWLQLLILAVHRCQMEAG